MIDAIIAAMGGSALPLFLIAKVTAVLAVAGAATVLLARASAATRHMVWGIAVVGVLALPLLAMGGPRWEVPWEGVSNPSVTSLEAPPGLVDLTPAAEAGAAAGGVDRGSSAAPGAAGLAPSTTASSAALGGMSWQLIAWITWGVGTILLLMRIVIGWLGTRRLSRRSERVTDEGWLQLLKDASWMLDVEREVVLLRSSSASMPMTWGTLRPTILLPAEADHWPDERRRVVLLHEMAHVARRDCLTQTLAEIATALYWFHPLAWLAAGQLRREREKACDDRVLAAGEGATSYAGHLLEVARAYRGQGMYRAAAIGMARPSQLEGRLLAVLDGARRRASPARREILIACSVAAIVVFPLAALHAVQPGDADESSTLLEQVRSTIAASGDGSAVTSGQTSISELLSDGQFSRADSIVDLSVAARPGGTVVFELEGGDLRVVGWENDSVELHAELRGRSAAETVVELTSRNGRVTVVSEYVGRERNRGGNHSFELRVPVNSNLEIENGGGELVLENLSGLYSGSTGGGDITITRLAGRAELSTGGGNVHVSNSRLNGTVTTGGGNVTVLGNAGDLRGTTGGGNVRIENSESVRQSAAGGVTRVHTGGGDIQLLDLPGGADLATGGGNITVRSVGGPLIARTGGGNIRVDEADASVDTNTGSGDVGIGAVRESAIVRTGSGNIRVNLIAGGRERSVDLETGSGNVTLELPADFGGSFEVVIESRNPNAQLLRSDFPLATEIRRVGGRNALRGTGVVGSGRDRVIIHTSSGNVTIRRAGSGQAAANRSVTPNAADRDDQDMNDFDHSIDVAFDEAFGEDFERHIEEMVGRGVGSFASGIAQFTADVTASALGAAAAALERAERDGSLSVEFHQDLEEHRDALHESGADR